MQTSSKKSKKKPVPRPARSLADALRKALSSNKSVTGWTLRSVETRSRELYLSRLEEEASRQVHRQRAEAVLYTSSGELMGSSSVTLVPGEEKLARERVDAAVRVAASTAMEPFPLPGPTELPEVAIADEKIRDKPADAMKELRAQLRTAIEDERDVSLASAEFFLHSDQERFENSEGLLADRSGTRIAAEIVVLGYSPEGVEAERQRLRRRRRVQDLEITSWVKELAAHARDAARAEPGPSWEGTVILPAGTLTAFFRPVVQQASAENHYRGQPSLELDQPVHRGELTGETLRLGADPTLPYGRFSNVCDEDGVPARAIDLIEEGVLRRRWAALRFGHYLGVKPAGRFSNLVVGTGTRYERDMRDEAGILEVVNFSWLNPNPATGDVASEVRFGYLSRGMARIPIRGGLLTGNVFAALANCQYSREEKFVGNARVPAAIRVEGMRLAGS
jgi:predicted Zn-dependent protease